MKNIILNLGVEWIRCILMMVLMISFTSCGDDETELSKKQLYGKWYTSYSKETSPNGYEFLKDGSGYHFYGDFADPLKWTFDGAILTAIISDGSYWNLNGEVIGINKERMVIKTNPSSMLYDTYYRSPNGDGQNHEIDNPKLSKKAPTDLSGLKVSLYQYNAQDQSLGSDLFEFKTSSSFTCDFSSMQGTYSYTRNSDTSAKLTMEVKQLWSGFTRTITYSLNLKFDPNSEEKWDFSGSGTKVFKGGLDAGSWSITIKGYYK